MSTTRRPAAVSGDANAAALSERVRISSIIESPEGKRNPSMASELALRTSLDVEQAKVILARSPIENPYMAALEKEASLGIESQPVNFTEDAKTARLKEIREMSDRMNAARRAGRL